MVDTVRGVLRVRAWPKKYGKARSALQQSWIDWFTQANRLAKYADGLSQARAIEMTKGSGMYPRDVLLKAMRGRLYFWSDTTGWKWYSMAAIGDISESLDVLAQTVGDVLTRAADRWRAVVPGNLGDVLTNAGPGNPAAWSAPAPPVQALVGALAGKTANQSIPNGLLTVITWDSELYDTSAIHDNVTNNSRFTVPAGWNYARAVVCYKWGVSGVGSRFHVLFKNGAEFQGTPAVRLLAINANECILVMPPQPVVGGDYFEAVGWQNTGAALAMQTSLRCSMSLEKVS